MVSELFDARRGRPVDGFDFTDITYHRAVDHGHRADRVRPARGAQRLPAAAPSTSCYRALDHARHVHRRRLRAAHRQRPVAQGRRLGVLLRRRPADPRQGRLPVRRGRRRPRRSTRPRRAAAHPRGAAADPLHAQGRHLRRPRLGGRRRAQPARRLRPDPRQRASTPGSSRPTPTSASFDGGFGSAYLARQVGQKFAREIFFLGDEYSAEDAHRMGMVNAVVAARRAGGDGAGVGRARSTARARPPSGC